MNRAGAFLLCKLKIVGRVVFSWLFASKIDNDLFFNFSKPQKHYKLTVEALPFSVKRLDEVHAVDSTSVPVLGDYLGHG